MPNVEHIQEVLSFWQLYRYFQTAVDLWPVHGTCCDWAVSCRFYDRNCTFYTHSVYIWKLSDQWRISSLITSSSLKYPLTLKFKLLPAKLRFTFDQFEFLFRLHSAPAGIWSSIIFEASYWEFTCCKFSATNQSNSVFNWSYWFRILI